MLHLVRHGETLSYDDDAGLTELGLRQAEHRGRALSSLVRDGARIGVVYAPTERARSTAGQVSHALLTAATESGKRVEMAAGYPDEGFGNVSLWVDGKAMEPTQTRRLHLALVETGGPEPGWVTEASRFWAAHAATGDAMTFWLTTPLLWHEPPGAGRLSHPAGGTTARRGCRASRPPTRCHAFRLHAGTGHMGGRSRPRRTRKC